MCSNKPSVHLFRCVLGYHQLPENSRRRQLGLFDVKFWFGQVMSTVAGDLPFSLGILSLPVGRKMTRVMLLFTLHLLQVINFKLECLKWGSFGSPCLLLNLVLPKVEKGKDNSQCNIRSNKYSYLLSVLLWYRADQWDPQYQGLLDDLFLL